MADSKRKKKKGISVAVLVICLIQTRLQTFSLSSQKRALSNNNEQYSAPAGRFYLTQTTQTTDTELQTSIIGGSCHKYNFCRDKFCRNKTPNFCRDKIYIVLLRQKFCRGKHTFVATKDVFRRDKSFVTKWCLWQLPPTIDKSLLAVWRALSACKLQGVDGEIHADGLFVLVRKFSRRETLHKRGFAGVGVSDQQVLEYRAGWLCMCCCFLWLLRLRLSSFRWHHCGRSLSGDVSWPERWKQK